MTWTSLTTPSTGERISVRLSLPCGAAKRLLVDRDLGGDLAALVERLLAELEVGLGRLGLGLAHRGNGLALLLARGGDPALEVDDFPPLFDAGRSAERCSWRRAAPSSATCFCASARLPCRLLIVAAASAASRRAWSAAACSAATLLRSADGAPRAAPLRRRSRCPGSDRWPPVPSAVSREARAWSDSRFGLELAQLRGAFGIVEPRQQLALVDALARADEQLADRRRIGSGDDLELARRDDLALARASLRRPAPGSPTAGTARTPTPTRR